MAEAPANPRPEAPSIDAEARPIVLVGLMGAGKSCVGKKLAKALDLPFRDSDEEVEKAAGCTVRDIFDVYGEPAFRDCERRVIHRLLEEGPSVIATGGGAFMDDGTRNAIHDLAVSVWLRASPETLHQRTKKSKTRPLLQKGDALQTLQKLADIRYPVYGEANIIIDSGDEGIEQTVAKVLDELGRTVSEGKTA